MKQPRKLIARFKQTPFINGGLFDCLDSVRSTSNDGYRIDCFSDNAAHSKKLLSIPNRLFFDDNGGLIPLLNKYKFTIEENTPIEQEVALDPELLGNVFENLLAAYTPETSETARKQTGSYYTPRSVVDYMVDAALVESLAQNAQSEDGDLAYWRDRLHYLLDYAYAFDDAKGLFTRKERAAIVRAIANIKVLDPAVGSGAFPMSVLHKLTLALRRIDKKNTLWKKLQIRLAGARATSTFHVEDKKERGEQLAEINSTFERYQDSDYGRKLYLIQNSIFGVDIQPIACQIAKLRFFISLAIEQQPTEKVANNFGIRPLPNLETRFVAANTLVGLDKPKSRALIETDKGVRRVKQQLRDNREQHFHATTREQKLQCIENYEGLRSELAKALKKSGFPGDAADQIAHWNIYDQNRSADWFDADYMFGIAEGFDLVVGNPPYVEARNKLLPDELKTACGDQVKSDWGETLPRGSDLLIYFYARSPKLLNKFGWGCFITQNAWLNTNYGKKFQNFSLDKFSFKKILDTSSKFFHNTESQNINAVISLFTKKPVEMIEFGIVDNAMKVTSQKMIEPNQAIAWGQAFLMPKFFSKILDKILASPKTGRPYKIGQGLNLPTADLREPGAGVPIVYKDAQFVARGADRSAKYTVPKRRHVPALFMPRGIGSRHYCTFNLCRAYSYSHVELYLPDALWGSSTHYCLWLYLNSSLVWLFREIAGRKNLGGGLLKAEATDMAGLPP